MRYLINIGLLILLLIFIVACRKNDEKIEELIIGEWEVESKSFLGWSATDTYNYSNRYIFDTKKLSKKVGVLVVVEKI